ADLDPSTILLILAPDRPFSPDEVGSLRAFLDAGGRLLIADEEGNANPLLADLGSSMRVRPGNLSSLNRDHVNPGLFTVSVVGNDTLFAGVETVRVNRPAAVEGGEPLLETSPFTWDDADGDGRISGSETFGAAIVCAREGNLTVLGDASLFVNAMFAENPKFIENLQPIRVDGIHSRTGTKSPIINTLVWIRTTPPAGAAIVALGVLPVAWIFGRKRDE
ncbi:MAG TPA: DUF4350 domain-containing protein, partial [Methanoculleus sp.]|nr:DUF4350 domain-containing protein [Methanoculleus sp.]